MHLENIWSEYNFDLFMTSLFFNSQKTTHTGRLKFLQNCLKLIQSLGEKNKSIFLHPRAIQYFNDYYEMFGFFLKLCPPTKSNVIGLNVRGYRE